MGQLSTQYGTTHGSLTILIGSRGLPRGALDIRTIQVDNRARWIVSISPYWELFDSLIRL